jgi:hypothetical protein
MYHLRSENFSAAAVSAAECATRVPHVAKATTLLSIAKLSAKLASEDLAPPHADVQHVAKVLFMPQPKAETAFVDKGAFEVAVSSLNADLAVLKAQETLNSMLPK